MECVWPAGKLPGRPGAGAQLASWPLHTALRPLSAIEPGGLQHGPPFFPWTLCRCSCPASYELAPWEARRGEGEGRARFVGGDRGAGTGISHALSSSACCWAVLPPLSPSQAPPPAAVPAASVWVPAGLVSHSFRSVLRRTWNEVLRKRAFRRVLQVPAPPHLGAANSDLGSPAQGPQGPHAAGSRGQPPNP